MRRTSDRSGQVVIIASFLLILLIIAIPAFIYVNRASMIHGAGSQARLKGRAIAEEGIAYAIQQLSKLGQWPYLGGTLPTPNIYPSAQGGYFEITYTDNTDPTLQIYQVGILSRPRDSANKEISGCSIFAAVSQKTVGVKLPTGLSGSACLQLTNSVPLLDAGADLEVWWGPVVSFDPATTFTLSPWMIANKAPRKFGPADIAPRSTTPPIMASDQKEYWAHADLGFPAPIDLSPPPPAVPSGYYYAQALLTAIGPAGALPPGWDCVDEATEASLTNCLHPAADGVFTVPLGSKLVIDGVGGLDWQNTATSDVIYVMGTGLGVGGSVELKNVQLNLNALIVAGNLTVGDRNDLGGLMLPSVIVPITAGLEYPYFPVTPTTWPCRGFQGQACLTPQWNTGASNLRPSFRGFLYVGGNMRIRTGTTVGTQNHTTTILGTTRIDGTLTIDTGVRAVFAHDSRINHAIRTSNFELQIDSTTSVN